MTRHMTRRWRSKNVSRQICKESVSTWIKIQSCSEWPETHFGFGIFEIPMFLGGDMLIFVNANKHVSVRQDEGMYVIVTGYKT